MGDYRRPLPVVNDLNRPHWEAAREHTFVLQQCRACGHRWFPPLPNCNRCLGTDIEWTPVSGKGSVHSFVVYHKAWIPAFQDEIPYNVALIELEEGVRLINTIVGADNADIRVGMLVEVAFEEVAPDVAIPRFRPAR